MNSEISYNTSQEYSDAVRMTKEKVSIHELINFDKKPQNDVKVSVIVPVCNVEQYLRECLDSILNQTLKDIEIICVNDGSSDSCPAILREYAKKDDRIKVIDKDNAGYGHAMNIGMDMACGEYIGIVESDDYIKDDMYEKLYEVAKKNDLDWVKADFNRFVVENGVVKCSYNAVAARKPELYDKVLNPAENKVVFKFIMQTWAGIYSRKFIQSNNIRHNETPGASYQDNGFWFQTLIYATRIMFYKKPYYMNRRDNPNSSVHSKSKVYCMNTEYAHIRQYLENDRRLFNLYVFQYNYRKYVSYLFTYRRIGEEYKWEYLNVFNKELVEADTNGEIDWEFFDEGDRKLLMVIRDEPQNFYANEIINARIKVEKDSANRKIKDKDAVIEELRRRVDYQEFQLAEKQRYIYRLWNSTSNKIGRGLTYFARKYKDKQIYAERLAQISSNNIVHIAMITDDKYAMPTAVSITSMKKNKWERSIYKIHILASKLSEDSKEKLMSLNSEDFVIDIIEIELDQRFKGMTKKDGDLHVTEAAIAKFRIPEILANVGKVLYIDGDTLVQKDLSELYNIQIPGKYAAVVKDIIFERNPKHKLFLKTKNRWYFNSGMMLLNLTKMRKDNICDKLVDYRLHGINHFMDQDALNMVFGNNLLFVSPQYNFLNKFYDWWDAERLSVFYGENIPQKDIEAYKNATIIHLGSHEKPWIYNIGYLSRLYKKYYKLSPYKKEKLKLIKLEEAQK